VIEAEEGSDEAPDRFVPPGQAGLAIDDDLVEAEPGPQGTAKVTRVIRRGRAHLSGTYLGQGRFEADAHRVPGELPVTGRARKGDKVLVAVGETKHRVERVMGRAGKPEVEDAAVLAELSIAPRFPRAVLAEAKSLREPGAADLRGRLDLRDATTVVTIDPVTSRDFDDAISLEQRGESWRLGVHIADVSHYVTEGMALDVEARERGTSVYLPSRVIPMLPERLSNDLCSLREGVDRLAMSVLLRFDSEGALKETTFAESVIRSDRRFSYENASRVMDRTARFRGRVGRLLREMAELATRLRRRRGGLALPRREVDLVYDPSGRVVDVRPTSNDVAHGVIEEFMLAANREVARLLLSRSRPALFRHHPEPPDFSEVRDALRDLGVLASGEGDLGAAVARAVEEGFGPAITSAMFRVLPRALYTTAASSHFALGFEAYTHFTSPIRRYADLVVHRHLRELLRGHGGRLKVRPRQRYPRPRADEELESLAQHVTARAGAADRAESRIRGRRVTEYLLGLGSVAMEGQITGVSERGLSVDLLDFGTWGFLSTDRLPGRRYRLEKGRLRAGRRTFRLGDAVRVRIESSDPATGRLELRLEP
jgi:ribonuclease R